ncbi:HNH endonuclease [Spectribacter hydrogenooxidans]|uniref:Putative HNH nuclease YajD n=1 Tax=Spectribacter hydrogenoxidans TaxID=3075608 RepID=A0ABU3C0Z2_9GAMM|nr:HNH endonuclease [Salinisphaera sp. W335]MDT0635046.1 HNH endonuclease [Salinisphaera sp. W335]
MKRDRRPSRAVLKSRRWPALRIQALRRDGWRCVQCGRRGRLEVDHIQAVRHAPALAFDLANLQTLCPSCHSRKTRRDIGLPEPDPERDRWRELLRDSRCT